MLQRHQKIINNLTKKDINFAFYEDFAKCLQVYNDLKHYFKIKHAQFHHSETIIKNISFSLYNDLDIDSLIIMYPLRIEYHLHFFVILKEMNLGFGNRDRYFHSEVIQKNEWEIRYINYINQLILFLLNKKEYPLKSVPKFGETDNINLKEYIGSIIQKITIGYYGIFNDLVTFLLEELND